MKKSDVIWMAVSAVLMVLFPGLAAAFAPHDVGMALCFLLFFAADPIFALALGVFSGLDLKRRWYQPGLAALEYLAGTWLFLAWGEPAFLRYMGGYLFIGVSAMLITWGINATMNRNQQERL